MLFHIITNQLDKAPPQP